MNRTRCLEVPLNMGALIETGPDNWQILQRQVYGTATVGLSGHWHFDESLELPVVKARAVLEETGETVVPWAQAAMEGDRGWSCRLTLPEGGLYRIETCLSHAGQPAVEWSIRGDMIHHVGVGDVFVIAGQSNAAGYGKDPVSDAPEIGIHLLGNDLRWRLATHPFNESTGTMHPANREGANPGHSPWLSFAKRMRKQTNVPVGLVQTALGGSPLSAWNPMEEGGLYRNMLSILAEIPAEKEVRKICGVLWYQGCSDTGAGTCEPYLERFGQFVEKLREDLQDPSLPIMTVQIGRCTGSPDKVADLGWSLVREAQRQAAHQLPHVLVVPALDLPMSDDIHISSAGNLVIGERVAKAFLGVVNGKTDSGYAPEPVSAVHTRDRTLRVRFAPVPERLLLYSLTPEQAPFRVTKADGTELVPVSMSQPFPDELELVLPEDPGPGCHLHGANVQNPYPIQPTEVSTRLPLLSFHGFPVTEA